MHVERMAFKAASRIFLSHLLYDVSADIMVFRFIRIPFRGDFVYVMAYAEHCCGLIVFFDDRIREIISTVVTVVKGHDYALFRNFDISLIPIIEFVQRESRESIIVQVFHLLIKCILRYEQAGLEFGACRHYLMISKNRDPFRIFVFCRSPAAGSKHTGQSND